MIEPESVCVSVKHGVEDIYIKRHGDCRVEIGVGDDYKNVRVTISGREAEHLRRALSRAIREIKEIEEGEGE